MWLILGFLTSVMAQINVNSSQIDRIYEEMRQTEQEEQEVKEASTKKEVPSDEDQKAEDKPKEGEKAKEEEENKEIAQDKEKKEEKKEERKEALQKAQAEEKPEEKKVQTGPAFLPAGYVPKEGTEVKTPTQIYVPATTTLNPYLPNPKPAAETTGDSKKESAPAIYYPGQMTPPAGHPAPKIYQPGTTKLNPYLP
jgi:hypothetical protein